MNYQEAEAYLAELQVLGMVPGLASIRELCGRLGNPQAELKFVHLAGTNGKGSVLALISTVLKTAGYRTGRYISPTIFEYRERIQINGHIISKADFCRYLAMVKEAADNMAEGGLPYPTPFEIDTAMAFCYFRDKACDIVVLETGMGGTFDATNVIENTIAAVITPISRDHTDYLGDSDKAIAENKAGIIKAGCQVVSARQIPEVSKVIAEKCRQLACPLTVVQPEQVSAIHYGNYAKCRSSAVKGRNTVAGKNGNAKYGSQMAEYIPRQSFTYGIWRDMEISLAGKYQIDNAALALTVLAVLAEQGFPATERKLRRGMAEAVWPGRFQLFPGRPLVIADGAHNVAAAEKLAESLKFYFTNKRIIYIMGILRDKDYRQIIERTYELAAQIITVTTPGKRGMHGYELAREVGRYHGSVTAADSLEEGVEMATLLAGTDGIVVAFGSLSYLGVLIKIVEKQRR